VTAQAQLAGTPERIASALLALVLSAWVVSVFLSHWSLLDGFPRNGLSRFLESKAYKPFAYRVLAPAIVNGADAALPESVRTVLADRVAPALRARYLEPLFVVWEPFGVNAPARADWERSHYRSAYVLMVLLMFGSLAGAVFLIHDTARMLGASAAGAFGAMLLYAAVLPTLFLNGGYFYDFTEQLFALLLLCCVLRQRWLLSLIVVALMQLNKETALLMVLFVLPFVWRSLRGRSVAWIVPQLAACGALLWWVRSKFAGSQGESSEWHLPGNLEFWSDPANWIATEDLYSVNFPLPRITFFCFGLAALLIGWIRRNSPTPALVAATLAFATLLSLLVTKGFRDEWRNLSLAVPLLVLLLVERPERRTEAGNRGG
jgi:hypothetical protein